jgi:Fe-S-cluster containining protein
VLDSKIEDRCRSIRADHPWWPCAKGCDRCCRSLPHLPTVTRTEWERLAPALSEAQRARLLEDPGTAPVTCPLLGPDGTCTVYAVRPIACRTYGFYTERDAGLHCAIVTEAVGDTAVIWGNGEAIAADLRQHGPEKSLSAWLRDDET